MPAVLDAELRESIEKDLGLSREDTPMKCKGFRSTTYVHTTIELDEHSSRQEIYDYVRELYFASGREATMNDSQYKISALLSEENARKLHHFLQTGRKR